MIEGKITTELTAGDPPATRPEGMTDAAWVVGSSVMAALSAIAAIAWSSSLPEFLPALPFVYVIATLSAGVATYLLAIRAAATADITNRWMAWAYALAGLAMGVQILGFPTIAPDGGIFGTTSSGAAGLYLVWHLTIPCFAILACCGDTRRSRPLLVAANGTTVTLILFFALDHPHIPVLIEPDGSYSDLLIQLMGALAVISAVSVALWFRRSGRRTVWTHAWVGASLTLGFWDILMHTFAQERFTVFWWSSLTMRLSQFVVLAGGLLVGLVALLRRTSDYADEASRYGAERARAEALGEMLRSKDRYIASIAHELRTPMTAILGLSEELAAPGTTLSSDEVDEFQLIIRDEARDLHDLIEDLLLAARVDSNTVSVSLERSRLDLQVREVVSRFSDRGIHVIEPAGAVDALIDPPRFRRILRNLVGNAIEHGGEQLEIHTWADEEHAYVSVIDDGPGIVDGHDSGVFDHHHGSSRSGRPDALGFGLATCRALARLQGGDVTYSRLRGTTVFQIRTRRWTPESERDVDSPLTRARVTAIP